MSREPKRGFCGCTPKDAFKFIRGIDLGCFICDLCVFDCLNIIEDQKQTDVKTKKPSKSLLTPKQIVEHLDQYVVGQDWAKKVLSVAVYDHFKRIGKESKTEISKSNVLLIGPTGSGKTFIVETIARLLKVPFAIADATSLTEAGYVGDDVDSVLVKLVQNAEGDIRKAEHGIIYIDEIDKIACRDSRGRDVSGEGVQQGLLKMLEGSLVSINPNGKKSAQAAQELIDTKHILFICGGAFSGITDQSNKKKSLGLGSLQVEKEEKIKLRHKDLVKYGMIPEFIGRFPLLAQLDALEEADLIQILTEPKNAITKQYQELLSFDGVNLSFHPDLLAEVAKRAKAEGTGARGLRAIIEPALTELMYSVPEQGSDNVEVTKEYLDRK